MRTTALLFVLGVLQLPTVSCNSLPMVHPSVHVDTLFTDDISIRALAIRDGKLWYGADKARYGYVELKSGERKQAFADSDSIKGEFRSIGVGENAVYLLNTGSPAKLFKVSDDLSRSVVFTDTHPDAFYDSMLFVTQQKGIAVGDPVNGCFSILRTWDGGNTWKKSPCAESVANVEGEAAFAASNSNLASAGGTLWIFTGGKISRVLRSQNFGNSWTIHQTPMISGKSMTGTFAGDFYDSQNGLIVGGDYENQGMMSHNKARSLDGGKTWQTVGQGTGFGYASCVRYFPKSNSRKAISVGPSGVFQTIDGGLTWQKILADPDLHTLIFAGPRVAYAGGRGKIIRIAFR